MKRHEILSWQDVRLSLLVESVSHLAVFFSHNKITNQSTIFSAMAYQPNDKFSDIMRQTELTIQTNARLRERERERERERVAVIKMLIFIMRILIFPMVFKKH
jgi:hypothetical protein